MDTPQIGQTEKAAPKGINWLTVFGLIILILLICVVIVAIWIGKQGMSNPIVQSAMRLEPAIEAMQDMTQSQIEQQAAFMLASQLAVDPYGFDDRYVVLQGSVSREESIHVEQNIARNVFSDANYGAYVLDDAIVMIDITGEAPEIADGMLIKGFGKVFVVNIEDIWELPIVGPNLEQEFSGVEGMEEQVVFFLSKGLQIVEGPVAVEGGFSEEVDVHANGEDEAAEPVDEEVEAEADDAIAEPEDEEAEPVEDGEEPEAA